MRLRIQLICAFLLFATNVFAKEVYLSIGGSVNNFRTDARILNPSATKDITVDAAFLPIGNVDNTAVQPVRITIPKRQMVVYDDVVSTLLHASGLGAIRLSSADDFVATQRIYAATASGTLGQFVPGLEINQALFKGVVLQLKNTANFRTNIGMVNIASGPAHVTFYLYDKNNAVVGTPKTETLQPYGVIGPTNFAGYLNAGTADLSDAWISFTSDQPIFVYGSVIDNQTTDPTFITASADSGAPITTPPPATSSKTFDVTLSSWEINIVPKPNIAVGDKVTFRIRTNDSIHGFQLFGPDGENLVPSLTLPASAGVTERTFTATKEGTYSYFCTYPSCGAGHTDMSGTFTVGKASGDDPKTGY